MARIPTTELQRYLLHGKISRQGCIFTRQQQHPPQRLPLASFTACQQRRLHVSSQYKQASPDPSAAIRRQDPPIEPLRKQLKEQARALKATGKKKKAKADNQTVPGWELTVGIEIHAQLNTARKLFSPATASTSNDTPNSNVALFDIALPGSQPVFQEETLIPALRAALALDCDIQKLSRFDRKHYFHWDQPAGYQITQYYEPFAKNGKIVLYPRDGIAPEDGERVEVGIKQIQMEQDTAKTIAQPGETHYLDFNRVGVPLIEIITHPDIHHPATAAALVRKIQLLLNAVDACVLGMESGGLRADVNVSVRRTDNPARPLGTRTEIKNLSSFKAVEDAIIAERDRQIALLEDGGVVEGETRGWSLGSTETRRLRGKEGEVDYRYMPDPDLGPVVVGEDLVEHLRATMGILPDAEANNLVERFGLSSKDAISLMLLDDGGRIQYFYNVLDAFETLLRARLPAGAELGALASQDSRSHAILAANWCLHELGKLTASSEAADVDSGLGSEDSLQITPTGECRVAAEDLAEILFYLHQRRITANVAKELLWAVFRQEVGAASEPLTDITTAIEKGDLWFKELSREGYAEVADAAVQGQEKVLKEFQKFEQGKLKAYPQGKLMFLVGRMMRLGPEGRMDPKSAEEIMRLRIKENYLQGL